MNWPPDERDELGILARYLAEAHADVQIALLSFFIEAETGEHVSDDTYGPLFRAIGRLQQASIQLRITLVALSSGSRGAVRLPGYPTTQTLVEVTANRKERSSYHATMGILLSRTRLRLLLSNEAKCFVR